MTERIYIGLDECGYAMRYDPLVIVACPSVDMADVELRRLEKRRYLDEEVLHHDFLYMRAIVPKGSLNKVKESCVIRLVEVARERFAQNGESIEIYFDAGMMKRESLVGRTDLGISAVRIIACADKKLTLVNKADHLASVIYRYLSEHPVHRERIERLKFRSDWIDGKLEASRVNI